MLEAIIIYNDTLEHEILKCSSISDLTDFVANRVVDNSVRIILVDVISLEEFINYEF